MTLSDQQWAFLQDVARLIEFAKSRGFKLTFGEAFRTPEQQKIYMDQGKSKTAASLHLKRLAVDFNIFLPSGELLSKKEDAQVLGDYWESLSPQNSWGGNWSSFIDTPHFERRPR